MTALDLVQLNIEYGGMGVSFDAVIETIRASEAPVAALQEGCGQIPRIADALGWPYFDNRTQVVSRLPLLDPPEPGAGLIYVEIEPGRVVAIINVHPASRGYGATRLGKGESMRRVMRRERRLRVGELQPSLDAAAVAMNVGLPVILLGDFNAPSHLDWTDAAVGIRSHVTAAVRWPTSVAVEEIGLVDVYRTVHPDPVAEPGLTWPAARPFVEGYNPGADGHPADRIDFMHVSGDVGVEDIQIIGEAESAFSDLTFTPWPTDHRGLLASLQVSPVRPPDVVSVSRRLVTVGDEVVVRVIAEGVDVVSVVSVAHASEAEVTVDMGPDEFGVAEFDTTSVGDGVFVVKALDRERRELGRASLWVAGVGVSPQLATDRTTYAVGDPVTVSWSWSPGNRADWVAVYARGADPSHAKLFVQTVTGATIEGCVTFDQVLRPKKWPLAAGKYTVHLLSDDLPVSLASADFAVR
ncbi:MAG: endonuclease/exonuclease/phosphatase family protein [Actinomycetes bacterium]